MSWAKSTPFQPKAVCYVGHERVRVRVIPGTDEPRDHELRVGIQRGVGPDVALAVLRGVLRLRPNERPNLVGLDPLGLEVAKHYVLIGLAELADLHEQLEDGGLCCARQASGRPDGVACAERPDDVGATGVGQLVRDN